MYLGSRINVAISDTIARTAAAFAFTLCAEAVFSQGIASSLVLGAEDAVRLGRGEAVVRTVDDPSKLSLAAEGEFAEQLRSRIASLKPNYLSEVMLSIPYRKGAIEELAAVLANVKGYVRIEYYSKRNKITTPLFDKVVLEERRSFAGGEVIEATQHMEPFTDYSCRYRYRVKASPAGPGSELFFIAENTSPIGYNGVQAVTAGNMAWVLYAFPAGDRIVFYGVGGVRAFDMLGTLRERLEPAFIGRVEAFFGYMSRKLKG
jgi:hypothetical protein